MTNFTNERFKKLAGLLKEQADFGDDEDEWTQSQMSVGEEESDPISDSLPEDLTTVGDLKALLSQFPDDMPVGISHEFGSMSKIHVQVDKKQYYKASTYGGDWHDDDRGLGVDGVGPVDIVMIEPG